MKYREIDNNFNLIKEEESVLDFWEKNNIFKKSVEKNSKPFVFYEGPPTANGRPGVHHVQSRTIKDIICRFKTMQGYKVERKGGWDTHGLPVEIEVEKEIGITEKEDIEKYGIDKFNEKCRNSVFKYKNEWEKLTKRIGFWIDLENPYVTLDNKYIESVWWALSELFRKGLLYQGHKITPYCPRCGTSLSTHEVAQGYKEVKDLSVYVKFKVKDSDTYFLVWTTTPWTLISNVALCLNPEEDYVKIEITNGNNTGEKYILAEKRLGIINEEYKVLEKYKGKDLEGTKYEQLFDYIKVEENAFFATVDDYVTMEDGTGIVHIAPAFGEDDYNVGKRYNLPVIQPVDEAGKYTEEVTDFKGRFVKECDIDIMKKLAERNLLYKKETVKHNYPHCWRCNTPLLYYARKSWYINVTKYRDKLLENNSHVKWYPPEIGVGRFGKWLENIQDWGISRSRYWGTPLNIWVCENCGHTRTVASIEEIKKEAVVQPSKYDLHRPYVDEIKFKCEKCGSLMHREPDVIDVWFDSGSMPFAQYHYPFENEEVFKTHFPADFISEGIDQTRGWFYSLMAISTMLFGKEPYKNVLVTELILDKDGQKMSKSRGNAVEPFEIINKYGTDALRYYLMIVSPPWIPTKFDIDGVADSMKFIKTIINSYSFFSMYANIDNFEYSAELIDKVEFTKFDRWILSELNSLIKDVTDFMNEYDITKSLKAITKFVDLFSNWYVRRNRRRFWKSEDSNDKQAAYVTYYNVLLNLSKLLAPFMPFLAEWLYKSLNAPEIFGIESVHLEDFPVLNESFVDKALEEEMEFVLEVVNLARSARTKQKIKIRQPLNKLIITVSNESQKKIINELSDIIKDEINVKNIEIIDKHSDLLEPVLAPNFKILGKKLGKKMGKVATIIKSMSSEEAKKVIDNKGLSLEVDGEQINVYLDELEIKWVPKEGLSIEENNGVSVGLDINITPELKYEGIARDLINRIQNTRKKSNLDVADRINLIIYTNNDEIKKAIEIFEDLIKNETLAINLAVYDEAQAQEAQQWDINGVPVYIKVEKK